MPTVYPFSPIMYGQTNTPGLAQQQTTALYTTEQGSDPEYKNHRYVNFPKATSTNLTNKSTNSQILNHQWENGKIQCNLSKHIQYH